MSPTVSVIMPTYNNSIYIKKAIESVIYQDVDCELLIIDDASCDNTFEIVEPYLSDKILYIKNKCNQGVAATRNRGIQLAKGKYIAFLDSDDWWKYGKLKVQVEKIQESNAVLCYTWRELFSETGEPYNKIVKSPSKVNYNMLLKNNSIACSSVLIESVVAKEILMEHDELHEDYLMWLKVLRKYGEAVGIEKAYLNSRMTLKGKSRNKLKTFKMTYGVYRCLEIKKILCLYYTLNHVVRSIFRYIR